MSFSITGNTGLKVTGLVEIQNAIAAMQREAPQVKIGIHRESATYFVKQAKTRVHKISHTLEKSISIDSVTSQSAIVSAKTAYARTEEERKGRRRIAPNTEHPYMKPAALDTSLQMPRFIKKGYDTLLARHKTR